MMRRITVTLLLSLSLALSALLVCGIGSTASAFEAMNASSLYPGVPNGYAYASYVITPTSPANVNYGPTVPVTLSCTTPPATNTITDAGPALPANSALVSGSATASITINRTASSVSVQTSEDIHNLSVLGGIIAANNVHAIVTSTARATGATSTNSSSFSGLTVAGLPVNNNPSPNTTLSLPGIGSVTLNEQSGPSNGAKTSKIAVILMDINIAGLNTVGLAPGTRIVIAYAQSGLQPSAVQAGAYTLYTSGIGMSTPGLGPASYAGIGCQAGSSTSGLNGYTDAHLGNTGNETSSASGVITSSSASSTAQNSISNVNLLGGLISASKVGTVANASWNGTGYRSGSATFINVKIAGSLLPSNLAPNTSENLPGIGYVILNEQTGSNNSSGASENVIGMDIHITVTNNRLSLPVGAQIIVSSSTAATSSY